MIKDPTDCGSAGHPMTCNCYYHDDDPRSIEEIVGVEFERADARPTRAPQEALLEQLRRDRIETEGQFQPSLLTVAQWRVIYAALQGADAAVVAPHELHGLLEEADKWVTDSGHWVKQDEYRCASHVILELATALRESAALVAGLRQELQRAQTSLAYWREEYERSNAEHRRSLSATDGVLAGLRALIGKARDRAYQACADVSGMPGRDGLCLVITLVCIMVYFLWIWALLSRGAFCWSSC